MPSMCPVRACSGIEDLHSPPPGVTARAESVHGPPQVRKDGTVKWLRPDGKTQVTVEYKKEGGAVIPLRVHTILISTQHDEDVTNEQIHKDLMEHVIKPVSRCDHLVQDIAKLQSAVKVQSAGKPSLPSVKFLGMRLPTKPRACAAATGPTQKKAALLVV